MTRAALGKLTQHLLRKYGVCDLADSDFFTIDNALDLALVWYAQATEAFKATLELDAAEDTALYSYWTIGETTDRSPFKVIAVTCDNLPLDPYARARFEAEYPRYRSDASGVPTLWVPESDGTVRVHPAPDSDEYALAAEVYTVPADDWSGADDEPPIAVVDHDVLPLGAFTVLVCDGISDEDKTRSSILFPQWEARIVKARGRIHGIGAGSVQVGRYAGQISSSQRACETITPAE